MLFIGLIHYKSASGKNFLSPHQKGLSPHLVIGDRVGQRWSNPCNYSHELFIQLTLGFYSNTVLGVLGLFVRHFGLSGMLERGTTPTSADKKLRNNILNFLVMLGTSAFLARHEVSNSFPMYLVPCWERARTYQSNESLNNVLSSCLSLTSAFIETIILALSQFL